MPLIMLSAVQHYAYCPRQCALIHLEQQFAQNLSTQRGNAVHMLVDTPETVMEKQMRVDRALPLFSHRHGLIGKADLVEWHGEIPYPVEYKHGPRGARRADELQLTGQAICLEEMTGKAVPEGALYHHRSRRRRKVIITEALKEEFLRVAAEVRALLAQSAMPPAIYDSRCTDCSLQTICQPQAVSLRHLAARQMEELFHIEEDDAP